MGSAASGWTDLRAGRWQAARARFEAADTPRECEGLAWAAWWLDDAEVTFAARERAHRGYRDLGDRAGAARTAIWMAIDELDFNGAAAPAAGWLELARRLLEPLDPCTEHGWLDFQEGYLAHAGGDTEVALERGVRVAELGRTLGVPDLEMLGLSLEGASLVARAEVRDGMRRLDEAGATALEGRAEVPIAAAWTFCLLVSACLAVADLERATAWCDRIAAFAQRYGSRYMLAFCRSEYGAVDVWRGSWERADALLSAAVSDFERSRPAWAPGPLTGPRGPAPPPGPRARGGAVGGPCGRRPRRAWCAWRESRSTTGRRTPSTWPTGRSAPPACDRRLDRSPALDVLSHAHARTGALERSAAALSELCDVARRLATPSALACADRAGGALSAARGEHDRARVQLEDAVDAFRRAGAPYEVAVTRLELARCLKALGRPEAAGKESAAARAALRSLVAASAPDPLEVLTPREREVLALVALGMTNRQVADRLVLSEHTVHRHVTNLLGKLGLGSRAAAAAVAARCGLTG